MYIFDNNSKKNFVSHLPVGFMDHVCFVYEVIAIREGWLMLGNHDFFKGEMDEIG